MSKFTPGPWVIEDDDFNNTPKNPSAIHAINTQDGWHIAEVLNAEHPDEDARLIAAAPAMYAVLTRLVFAADAKLLSEKHKVIQEARDAIAIAEGRE